MLVLWESLFHRCILVLLRNLRPLMSTVNVHTGIHSVTSLDLLMPVSCLCARTCSPRQPDTAPTTPGSAVTVIRTAHDASPRPHSTQSRPHVRACLRGH